MGVASLVLGVISLIIAIGGTAAGASGLGSICGILAIIFGAIARKNPAQKGIATGGLVLGIISMCWGIIVTIACFACVGAGVGLGAAIAWPWL